MPIANEELDEYFINLANINAKPLIKTIRTQLTAQVKKMETDYKIAEGQASKLSASIADNYQDYIAKLTELSQRLNHFSLSFR
ncbi:hypothetical protein BN59_03497 [Legionella massiliensis]|uniref:Uncharacterized protein n=1 Tax=Legionella massiliensis TaxID=1034943 RepID=A0A078L532_9GAMM|nr:hypothetical protein [Legionella massiliensis]CDZ79179.1 hypothetical protein BN59_03497 [Legionella massiliensis]CEE14917.1 hypothetical protein BN1094_03497 [Legionella massiliensis]